MRMHFKKSRIADRYQRSVRKHFMAGLTVDEGEDEKLTTGFVRIQMAWIALACLILIVGIGMSVFSAFKGQDEIRLSRNSFGQGTKSVPLILSSSEQEKEIILDLEESEPTEREVKRMFDNMFLDLRDIMKGDNPSLHQITESLNFPDTIPAYPFRLSYEVKDQDVIGLTGELTAGDSSGAEKETVVTVTAVYGNYREKKTYKVSVAGKGKAASTDPFQEVMKRIQDLEKKRRGERKFVIPGLWKGIRIKPKESGTKPGGQLILLFVLVMTVPVFRHLSLRKKEKKIREETEKDFSLLVHLLVVFTGAGLSFFSAIGRISSEYKKGKLVKKKRYTFEQILRLESWMESGYGQKDAVQKWAGRFSSVTYRKLSMILIQSFSKGVREAGQMMEQEEYRAFRKRIDQARKEGERAQTGLLLPMIVMLFLTMLMIMYPAMMKFYNIG